MYLEWGRFPEFDLSSLFLLILFLAISILLVKFINKRVMWLLPALVLYIGVGWEMGWIFMWIFRILFWGSAIYVLFTAFKKGRSTKKARLPLVLIVGLFIILLFSGMIGGTVSLFGDKPTARPAGPEDKCLTVDGVNDRETIQTALLDGWSTVNGSPRDCISPEGAEASSPSPTETVTVEPTTACPEEFVQTLDPNFRNRAVTEGFEGTPGEKRQQTLAAMARDYRYLDAVGGFVLDRDYDVSTLHVTLEDAWCLSEAGQNLYQQVKGALMASTAGSALAPADGYNSEFEDGTLVVKQRQGVRGDRRATVYSLTDGRELIILDRCGNLVFPESYRS